MNSNRIAWVVALLFAFQLGVAVGVLAVRSTPVEANQACLRMFQEHLNKPKLMWQQ